MTDMRRVTISLSDDLDDAILELRKQDEFVRCSYSEIVRYLLTMGLHRATEDGALPDNPKDERS